MSGQKARGESVSRRMSCHYFPSHLTIHETIRKQSKAPPKRKHLLEDEVEYFPAPEAPQTSAAKYVQNSGIEIPSRKRIKRSAVEGESGLELEGTPTPEDRPEVSPCHPSATSESDC